LSDLAAAAIPETHPARQDLAEIATVATHAACILQHLLAFARTDPLNPRMVDLDALLDELLPLLRVLLGVEITITTHRSPISAWVWADPTQLTQVIVNLALNARDALPHGGTLDLGAAISPDAPAGREQVLLRVRDNGVGMDQATCTRLFHAFATTKPDGQGIGLGLWSCAQIVAAHGGTIAITSAPGQGTTVTVTLPRIAAAPADCADLTT
jgi:two-component system cell cycle sensor histidine kinase/response regulator CckA